MRERAAISVATLGALLIFVVASFGQAQTTLPQTEDATTPARGVLRFRVISAWERYDSRFSASGTEPLGFGLTSDSLGVANIPELAPIQTAIQSAAGSPFKITFGQSRVNATTRINVVPIVLEYGITNRLSVGAFIPIVRQRIATEFLLSPFRFDAQSCFRASVPVPNPCLLAANVGPNPNRTSSLAAQENVLLQTQFSTAETQLSDRIQSCQSNPGAAGCDVVLAQGPQLLQSSQDFASNLGALYGAASDSGMAFVPLASSNAQLAIAARVADFNAQFRSVLSSSGDLITATPVGAGPAGSANIQQYLAVELKRDSVANLDLLAYGDIELGAKFRVLDRVPDSLQKVGLQLAVQGSVRLPTGSLYAPTDIADLRIGGGRTVVDSRAILDARYGRLGFLGDAHVGVAVSTRDSIRARPDTRVVDIDLAPRWHFSDALAVHGAYTMRSFDKSGSEQLVGGGVSFRSPALYRRGGSAIPLEMRFTHLEAITGSAGLPKLFVDEIELRLYYQLRNR